jgi:hypothetical protein
LNSRVCSRPSDPSRDSFLGRVLVGKVMTSLWNRITVGGSELLRGGPMAACELWTWPTPHA